MANVSGNVDRRNIVWFDAKAQLDDQLYVQSCENNLKICRCAIVQEETAKIGLAQTEVRDEVLRRRRSGDKRCILHLNAHASARHAQPLLLPLGALFNTAIVRGTAAVGFCKRFRIAADFGGIRDGLGIVFCREDGLWRIVLAEEKSSVHIDQSYV